MFNQIDLWLDFAVGVILMVLRMAGQDAAVKAKIKPAMLKIYKITKQIFAGDPDFT